MPTGTPCSGKSVRKVNSLEKDLNLEVEIKREAKETLFDCAKTGTGMRMIAIPLELHRNSRTA